MFIQAEDNVINKIFQQKSTNIYSFIIGWRKAKINFFPY